MLNIMLVDWGNVIKLIQFDWGIVIKLIQSCQKKTEQKVKS